MAQDDIYRLTVNYEGPTMHSSTALYYQEDALSTGTGGATQSLAFSWIFSKLSSFLSVLVSEWHITSVFAARVNGEAIAPTLLPAVPTIGARSGDSLPADNCLLMQLLQANHPRTSNGRLYLPGLSESDSDVGIIEAAFLGNQVVALGNSISSTLNENSGSGSWNPGVISAKVRDAIPGQKNWEDAFSPMIAALGNPVIARQVRRRTKVRGQST